MRTYTQEEFKKKYGEDMFTKLDLKPKKQSFGADLVGDIKGIGTGIKESYLDRAEKVRASDTARKLGEQGVSSSVFQLLGQSAGLVSDVGGELIKGTVKAVLPQAGEEAVKGVVTSVAKPVVESDPMQFIINRYQSLDDKTKRDVDAALGIGSLIADVVGIGLGGKAVKTGSQIGKQTLSTIARTGDDVVDTGARLTAKAIEKLSPPAPTTREAVGEVLQGATKDVGEGIKAFSTLDTTGVKTFAELSSKIDKQIGNLDKQVDTDLGKDTTKTLLKDLTVSAKTTGGNVVKVKPVEQALNHLGEVYEKIGDAVQAANIREILVQSATRGLTKLEVNDIARLYGREFGEKAFGKLGEPLTSVNAKLYENTRKALKLIARSGIKGKEAQKADRLMSSLYNTQTLIKRNVEAVNKLQQRIKERGLLEKVGNAVSKYADILTGGSLRGLVGGLLPRGAGYKVMNALDVEEALGKNLEIIQKAIKSGNDAEITKILQGLSTSKAK